MKIFELGEVLAKEESPLTSLTLVLLAAML